MAAKLFNFSLAHDPHSSSHRFAISKSITFSLACISVFSFMSFVFLPFYSSFILFFSAYFDVVIFGCCFWISFRPQAGSCQEFFVFVFFLFCFVLCLYSPGASWLHGSAARCCLPLFGSSAVLRSSAGRRARATGSAGPGEPRHLPFVMLRPVFAFGRIPSGSHVWLSSFVGSFA